MAIDQINGLSGFDPNKIEGQNKVNKTQPSKNQDSSLTKTSSSSGDQFQISEQAYYLKLALSDEVSTPNEGRISEIKAAIENGVYNDPKILEETADKIAQTIVGA